MRELHTVLLDVVHPGLVHLPLGQRPLPPEQEEVGHRPEYVDVPGWVRPSAPCTAPGAPAHIHVDDKEEQRSQNEALDVAQVSVMVLVTVVVVVSTTPARPDDAVTVRMLPQPKLCLPMYYGVPCWYIPRFPYVVPLH